jgi:hypothetical protein
MSYIYVSAGLSPPDIFTDNNSIYVTAGLLPNDVSYEIATSQLKLGQIFYIYDQFTPAKVSVYLKVIGQYNVPYFDISSTVVVDALNFSDLDQSANKLIPYEGYNNYSGKGSMYVLELADNGQHATLYYPIRGNDGQQANIYLRGRTSTGRFRADIYLDGTVVAQIDQFGAPIAAWGWFGQTFNIPDSSVHTLGIRMLEPGNALDRFCISQVAVTPDNVNTYQSSFITLHFSIYSLDANDKPDEFLYIYDYKTSLDELKNDDWYSFDFDFLDTSYSVPLNDKYAIVLFSSGGNSTNFLVWELTENTDPYICGPSAVRV